MIKIMYRYEKNKNLIGIIYYAYTGLYTFEHNLLLLYNLFYFRI